MVSIFPEELFTTETLSRLAKSCNGHFLSYLPANIWKTDVWKDIVKENPNIFCSLPKYRQSTELGEEIISAYLDRMEAGLGKPYLEAALLQQIIVKASNKKPFSIDLWRRLITWHPPFLRMLQNRPKDALYLQKNEEGWYPDETWALMEALLEAKQHGYFDHTIMQEVPMDVFRDMLREIKTRR